MSARHRGEFREGQAVAFTAGERGEQLGVLVSFAGTRWVTRTTDGRTWRVPAPSLRASALAPERAEVLLAAGVESEEQRATDRAARAGDAHERLAERAAEYRPGQRVEVVHRGQWWPAEVVGVSGGKVTTTNPTRDLLDRAAMLGCERGGRRTTRTVTVWASHVRAVAS